MEATKGDVPVKQGNKPRRQEIRERGDPIQEKVSELQQRRELGQPLGLESNLSRLEQEDGEILD